MIPPVNSQQQEQLNNLIPSRSSHSQPNADYLSLNQTMDTGDEETQEKKTCVERIKGMTYKDWLKVAFLVFLLSFVVVAIVYNDVTTDVFEGFLNWMEDNPILGGFVYIFVYTATTVLVIPGSLLTLGAGFVYFQLYGGVT